jgi:hypothetical protein
MIAPINKQTDTAFDLFGFRPKYSLHVATPPKRLLHRVGKIIADATTKAVEREIQQDDCMGGLFQYGWPVGESNFIDYLADFLSKEYKSPVKKFVFFLIF